jgi:biopolymer transport protein ExbB
MMTIERLKLERNLAILGTLGNSAPFIGLFGTVLGIIKAFSDLGSAANGGLNSISGGLAEALVTTATGLLVALPSAIAFNYFQRKMKTISSRASSLSLAITANSQQGPKS